MSPGKPGSPGYFDFIKTAIYPTAVIIMRPGSRMTFFD